MIQFSDYDRVSDTLLYLSNTITLNFNVILSRKDRNGGRSFFHYETEYGSKYIGVDKGRSIKRFMSFFFTIDNKEDFLNNFVLKPQDIYFLTTIIENKLFPLYFDPTKRIYKVIDNRLVIKGDFEPVIYAQSEYKYLGFTPIIYTYEDNMYKEGVRITINSESDYVDLDIDKFIGFYYILKNTDMYSAACNMTSYAKIPPYGVNVYSQQGLGGGAPVPEWSGTDITNDISQEKTNGKKNGNSFLDNTRRK